MSLSIRAESILKGLIALSALVLLSDQALCAAPDSSLQTSISKGRLDLIDIMKGVNFIPQLGADNPICKSFYADFKKQTNIEYIEPIAQADSYDDPALKRYRERCPNFDFRKSLSVPANQDTTGWTDEDWESLGTPTYGIGHFALYRADMDNNPKNGQELMFYYQGARTIVTRLPYGKPMTQEEYVDPAARSYQTLDLKHCKKSSIGGAGINSGRNVPIESATTGDGGRTRSGVIRYKGRYGIFILESRNEKQDYFYLTLNLYSSALKRITPVCTYHKPH